MALTAEQLKSAARRLAREMFEGGAKKTANLNLDDLVAAVSSLDAAMDNTKSNLAGADTIKQHLIKALPEPFASNSTAAEKALALSLWALAEAGAI